MIHKLIGTVTSGRKLGRKLGFPTANIAVADSEPVADGVYAGIVTVGGTNHRAMINVGRKPTVSESEDRYLEAHLFDFNDNLYDQSIEVELLEYIRAEQKFSSVEALRKQIEKDRSDILKYFNK